VPVELPRLNVRASSSSTSAMVAWSNSNDLTAGVVVVVVVISLRPLFKIIDVILNKHTDTREVVLSLDYIIKLYESANINKKNKWRVK
jgi:hypothetical protein